MAGELRLTKRTPEDLPYDFDFTEQTNNPSLVLTGTPTIQIDRQDKVTEVTPLTAGPGTINGGKAQFQISGGTDGELYKLVVTANEGSNVHIMTSWMEVEDVPDTTSLTAGTDTYATIAEADLYFSKRFNAAWQNSDPALKEAALREATQFLDGRYDWIGDHPGGSAQLLGWPRNNARDHEHRDVTGIPSRVKDATCEAALLALDGALVPADDRGGMISRAKIGPLEVTYDDGAPTTRSFDFLDYILKGLFESSVGGVNVKLARA